MSILEWRGGFPVVFCGTVSDAGLITDDRGNAFDAGEPLVLGSHQVQIAEDGRKGPITSKWIRIVNLDDTNAIKVYFSEDHFNDDVHHVTLQEQAAETISIFEGPAELEKLWLRSTGGTPSFEVTAFHRRG